MAKFYLLVVLLGTPAQNESYNLPIQGLPLSFQSMNDCMAAKKRLMPDESRALCFEINSEAWR